MTFQDLSNNYSIKWSTSVNDITLSDWEDIFGKSIIKSQRFFISIEKSDFQQITIYYLQISDNLLSFLENMYFAETFLLNFPAYLDLSDVLLPEPKKQTITLRLSSIC